MYRVLLALILFPVLCVAQPLVSMGGMIVEPEVTDPCLEASCMDAGLPPLMSSEPASEAPVVASAPASAPDLVKQGGEVVVAVKDATGGSLVKIAAAISLTLFFLINLIQKFGNGVLSGNTIRLITVVAGAVAALAGYISAGLPWDQMLQLFLAGPGAIAINEVVKFFKTKEAV